MSEEKRPLVDITGTMAKPMENWQERTEQLARPDLWNVVIIPNEFDLWNNLTHEERVRMMPKVKMVENCARYMLAGMVKGTVKYPSDDWTLERWMAHLVGEGADQMNYQLLTFDRFQREKAEKEEAIARVQRTWLEKTVRKD